MQLLVAATLISDAGVQRQDPLRGLRRAATPRSLTMATVRAPPARKKRRRLHEVGALARLRKRQTETRSLALQPRLVERDRATSAATSPGGRAAP